MLPAKTDFTQTGNLGGDEIKMAFDENSLAFLQGVLTDLYSDKEMACVREYATNALDSHKAAGQARPIEITTPTPIAPFFKVKDYGVGLSIDDIKKIYSKYGASTSRETNERTGMLGLGSKSALTYTNQFTVIAVKNGMKINVAVSRAEDGGGTMSVLSERPTDESNGVEIVIPVNKRHSFASKAQDFFKFWDPALVLIDGEPPVVPEMLKVTDEIYIKGQSHLYGYDNHVVMGGVTYSLDLGKISGLSWHQFENIRNVVFFVDMGEVNFTPSREQLHYTTKTMNTVTRLVEEFNAGLITTIQADIDSAETYSGALHRRRSWRKALYRSNTKFTYKEEPIPETFDVDFAYKYGYGERQTYGGKITVSVSDLETATVIVGFTGDKLTTSMKNKMRLWSESQGKTPGQYYICDVMPGSPWTDNIDTVHWDDVAVMRQPRDPSSGPKVKPTYNVCLDGDWTYPTDLDNTKPIWYITTRDAKDRNISCSFHSEGVQIVRLGANRVKALVKRYPTAQPLLDMLRKQVETFFAGVDEDKLKYLKIEYDTRSACGMLDVSRVDDPDLRSLIETVKGDNTENKAFQKEFNNVSDLAYKVNRGHIIPSVNNYSIMQKYPLLGGLRTYRASATELQHAHDYVNSVYQKIKEYDD